MKSYTIFKNNLGHSFLETQPYYSIKIFNNLKNNATYFHLYTFHDVINKRIFYKDNIAEYF